MNIADINRLEKQSKISEAWVKANTQIEDHLVIVEEIKQILEFESSKDVLNEGQNAPDWRFIIDIRDKVKASSDALLSIYTVD